MLVQGFQEKSRLKIMCDLRRFIMVDTLEAVTVVFFFSKKNMESRRVMKPKFTTDFHEAVVWEGADALTLRAEEGNVAHLH